MTSVVVQAVPLQQRVQGPGVLIQTGPHSELEPRPGLALLAQVWFGPVV